MFPRMIQILALVALLLSGYSGMGMALSTAESRFDPMPRTASVAESAIADSQAASKGCPVMTMSGNCAAAGHTASGCMLALFGGGGSLEVSRIEIAGIDVRQPPLRASVHDDRGRFRPPLV